MVEETKPKSLTLKERGIYFLNGGINPDASKNLVPWLLEAAFENKPAYDHLTLIINSPGGSVSDAHAIIDMMESSPVPIHTVGLGMIASCGLLIFIAGKHRILTPNTSILSHQYSWGSWGKEHELVAIQREFDLSTERMIRHYKKYTGLSEKKIRKKLLPPHDIWLSAEEALKLNLCDEIKLIDTKS